MHNDFLYKLTQEGVGQFFKVHVLADKDVYKRQVYLQKKILKVKFSYWKTVLMIM